jgi:hypothetical protein
MVTVQSVIFVSHLEESTAEHVGINGVYDKLGKRNTKGSMAGPRWNLEAEGACLSSPGAFKTYANPHKGRKQVIPTQ